MANIQKKLTPEQSVAVFLREHRLAGSRKPLLVAVSGGPDSVCLLHILDTLKRELGLSLYVAHLNHRLRGDDSVADAQYVLDLCHELGVPVVIEQRNVKAYQKTRKLSVEEAAREVRYRFLAEVAESIGAARVALGHTLDDHIETVLLNLLRGTGTRGLSGLQPLRRLNLSGRQLTVVRPLLALSREQTLAYCRQHHLQPRTDATNLSLEPTRNRIRLELLPLLKSYNPEIDSALLRTARIAADDIVFLEQTAGRHWRRIVRRQGDLVIIEKQALLKLPRSIQRLVLRQAVAHILGTLKDIEARHIEEMLALLDKPPGKIINLPYKLHFASEYDRFLLGADLKKSSPFPPLTGTFSLPVPGFLKTGDWKIHTDIITPPPTIPGDEFTAHLDADCIRGELTVHSRRPGDRFQPLGMAEEKKVGQFMIDARIPQLWRSRIPVVSAGERVVWVVGYRIDARVKITGKTKKVLRISFEKTNE